MNLEKIWVRNFSTTYGRASLLEKTEIPISLQKFSISDRNRNLWFRRKTFPTICINKAPHQKFLRIHHWKYTDSGPWQGAGRFSVRKHSEVIKIRFVSVAVFSKHNPGNPLGQCSYGNLRWAFFEWPNCELRPISPSALAVACSCPIDIINKNIWRFVGHP